MYAFVTECLRLFDLVLNALWSYEVFRFFLVVIIFVVVFNLFYIFTKIVKP